MNFASCPSPTSHPCGWTAQRPVPVRRPAHPRGLPAPRQPTQCEAGPGRFTQCLQHDLQHQGRRVERSASPSRDPLRDHPIRHADRRVRRAADVASGRLIYPKGTAWYEPEAPDYNVHDPDKAKALMKEAGYNGKPLRFLVSKQYDYMFKIGQVAQAQSPKWASLSTYRSWTGRRCCRNARIQILWRLHRIAQLVADPTLITIVNPSYPGWWDFPDKHAALDAFVGRAIPPSAWQSGANFRRSSTAMSRRSNSASSCNSMASPANSRATRRWHGRALECRHHCLTYNPVLPYQRQVSAHVVEKVWHNVFSSTRAMAAAAG